MARYQFTKDDISSPKRYYVGDVREGTPNVATKGMFIDFLIDGKTVGVADKFEVKQVDDATPLKTASPEVVAQSQKQENTAYVVGSIGLLAGLGYAFYKQKGFWGYVGFGLLGSIVAGVGYNIVKKK